MEDQIDKPEWFLQALQREATSHTEVVDGAEVFYRRWGNPLDPPVVLVHGSRCHTHWWDHVAPFLTDTHSVLALDLSGFGDSARRDSYGIEQWSRELVAVTDVAAGAGGGRPIVVAHSMGGAVAACAAAQAATRWRGLIAIDSSMGQQALGYRTRARSSTPFGGRIYPSAEEALKRFRLVPAQPMSLPYVLENIAQHSIRQTVRGWEWKFDPMTSGARAAGLDRDTFSRISCDLALLRAPHGRIAADAHTQLRRLLGRDALVVDIPTAHHHMMLDQPLAVIAALRTLLATWTP